MNRPDKPEMRMLSIRIPKDLKSDLDAIAWQEADEAEPGINTKHVNFANFLRGVFYEAINNAVQESGMTIEELTQVHRDAQIREAEAKIAELRKRP